VTMWVRSLCLTCLSANQLAGCKSKTKGPSGPFLFCSQSKTCTFWLVNPGEVQVDNIV
jgi:hypothetical protein